MKKPKSVTRPRVTLSDNGGHLKLNGWSEFDEWASKNHDLWKNVSERCKELKATEEMRTKLLCFLLVQALSESHDLLKRFGSVFGAATETYLDCSLKEKLDA